MICIHDDMWERMAGFFIKIAESRRVDNEGLKRARYSYAIKALMLSTYVYKDLLSAAA